MIKANELRIGNYIISNSGKWHYLKINSTMLFLLEQHEKDYDLSGISITEEILFKCGFDNDNGNEDWSNFDYEDEDKFILCGSFFNGNFIYTAGEGIPFAKPIKYLHQLQNLCFALTGEELEVNL